MKNILDVDFKVHAGRSTKEVQEHAFKLGFEWMGSEETITFTNCHFIFFDVKDRKISISNLLSTFLDHDYQEVTLSDFLAIKPPSDWKLINNSWSKLSYLVDCERYIEAPRLNKEEFYSYIVNTSKSKSPEGIRERIEELAPHYFKCGEEVYFPSLGGAILEIKESQYSDEGVTEFKVSSCSDSFTLSETGIYSDDVIPSIYRANAENHKKLSAFYTFIDFQLPNKKL